MEKLTAEEAVKRVFGDSTSPTAPRVKEYGWIEEGKIAYEFSEGTEDGKMYMGRNRNEEEVRTVTVVRKNEEGEWGRYHDYCVTFFENEVGLNDTPEEEAIRHIEELQRKHN